MKNNAFIHLIAIFMTLHFCAMSSHSYPIEKIAIETESEKDEESKDSKKEHKITNADVLNLDVHQAPIDEKSIHKYSKWNAPQIEVCCPPPDLR